MSKSYKSIAFVGKGDSSLIYDLFIDIRLERKHEFTFSFSRDIKGRFNEFARRLGLIVIMENPEISDWKKALIEAINDFQPDVIFNFGEDELPEIEQDVFHVEFFENFIYIYGGNESFVGDIKGAKKFLRKLLGV